MVYSLDETLIFDPFDLDIEVTPDTVRSTLAAGEHMKALTVLSLSYTNHLMPDQMSLRLNLRDIIEEVFDSIPPANVPLVAQNFPQVLLQRYIRTVFDHNVVQFARFYWHTH